MEWHEMYARLTCDRNDVAAWQAIERRVQGWARAALWQHGHEVVQDAVADTCASVAVTLARARGADSFRGFVLGHWLNTRRRVLEARPAAVVVRLDEVDVACEDSSDLGPEPEQLAWLDRALQELPERERRAVVLRYFEGFSACQISAALEVSACNARRLVFNGLSHLRRAAGAAAGC